MAVAIILLGTVAVGCVLAVRPLARARWSVRSPSIAIALWQALGLGWGLATIGALAGFGVIGVDATQFGNRQPAGGVRTLARVAAAATGPERPSDTRRFGSIAAAAERIARTLLGPGTPAAKFGNAFYDARLISLAASCVLLSVLCWILLASLHAVVRARHRQMTLLKLLAHGDPKVPGALVVDHPAAAAYCVPGLRSAIVFSAGTLDLLNRHELAAVLAHERAHLRARHDLVLLPFSALLRVFRWSGLAREANRAVSLLIEMLADDRARRQLPARELATALLRVGAAGAGRAPSGALAATAADSGELTARVTRLLKPPPGLPLCCTILVCSVAALVVAAPAAAVLLPL